MKKSRPPAVREKFPAHSEHEDKAMKTAVSFFCLLYTSQVRMLPSSANSPRTGSVMWRAQRENGLISAPGR